MTTIRVYNGGGSIKTSVALMIERLQSTLIADVRPIDSSEIISGAEWMKTTDVLLFAGASVRGFKKSLGESGIKRIYEAVAERGTTYCGVCAGAAFAASNIVYNVFEDDKNKKIENTGLGFYDGFARGPIKQITYRPFENTVDDIHVIDVMRLNGAKTLKSAYWSGPVMIPSERGALNGVFEATAVLKDTEIPLSLVGRHGKGRVVLYSFHPEITAWNWRSWVQVQNPTQFQQEKLNAMDAHLNGGVFDSFITDLGLLEAKKEAACAASGYKFDLL